MNNKLCWCPSPMLLLSLVSVGAIERIHDGLSNSASIGLERDDEKKKVEFFPWEKLDQIEKIQKAFSLGSTKAEKAPKAEKAEKK